MLVAHQGGATVAPLKRRQGIVRRERENPSLSGFTPTM
jgi:hypothetical protein